MGKRVRSLPALYDLDVRKSIVDGHKDYQQILSYPQPPFEPFCKTPQQIDEMIKICNDGFADLCAKEKDRFRGWVAQVALAAPDASVREVERAIKNGALGVQIYTNVGGKPIDLPEYRAVLGDDERARQADLDPSLARRRDPDYPLHEKKSLYEIWWAFGWSYETAAAMTRLVYSKTMDNFPNLKIIPHHFGGIVPMLEGRIGPGNDVDRGAHLGRGLCRPARSLKKRPLDYFQKDVWVDTAVFGGRGEPCAGSSSIRTRRSCSRPTARSIRKAARCIRARRCAFSTSLNIPRPIARRSTTRTWKRSPA